MSWLDDFIAHAKFDFALIRLEYGRVTEKDLEIVFQFAIRFRQVVQVDHLFVPVGAFIPPYVPIGASEPENHLEFQLAKYNHLYSHKRENHASFSELAKIPYTREFWIESYLYLHFTEYLEYLGEAYFFYARRKMSQYRTIIRHLNARQPEPVIVTMMTDTVT